MSSNEAAYRLARERYAALGVDTERRSGALCAASRSRCTAGRATTSAASKATPGLTGGGIQATGNYPGKARNADELRGRPGPGAVG